MSCPRFAIIRTTVVVVGGVCSPHLGRSIGGLRRRRRLHAVHVDRGDGFESLPGAVQTLRRHELHLKIQTPQQHIHPVYSTGHSSKAKKKSMKKARHR